MYKNILLAVDLGDAKSWNAALKTAVEYARAFGATLRIMTVVPDFGMTLVESFFPEDFEKKIMESAQESLHEFVRENVPKDITVQHVVGQGTVYEEIIRVGEEVAADLVILGESRPRAGKFLLGPNAGRVVRDAECSVLVVRD